MPILNGDTMETQGILGTGYSFSGKRVDDLGASEVTLVCIAVDRSGSTLNYQRDMEKCLGEVVRSCNLSPRAGNLMLRVITFDSRIQEFHGYKMLSNCNPDDYIGCAPPGGTTALYDAAINACSSMVQYGGQVYDSGVAVNGILFVITDGEENASTMTLRSTADAFKSALTSEKLESLRTVLIGLGVSDSLNQYLQSFKDGAGFDQYLGVKDASMKTLAKLGGFVSQSISSQSQALGTGGPSQAITF